jgi:hypothetical protein
VYKIGLQGSIYIYRPEIPLTWLVIEKESVGSRFTALAENPRKKECKYKENTYK